MKGPCIEWGIAQRVAHGETESGDAHWIRFLPNGVLLGVCDGLGHGQIAAKAARIAVGASETTPQEPLISIFKKCHDKLAGTRGVVMSVARINVMDGTLAWSGVGNVEGRLLRANHQIAPGCEFLLLRSGLVGGAQLPLVYVSMMPILAGDLLIFATDGVATPFVPEVVRSDPVQKIADNIIAKRGKNTDDALVLVARYTGEQS